MTMYCPGCSTPAVDGAKFCKSCGMNLTVINQALNGGVTISDPARNREYKRTRRQITDGINGAAIGAALLIASLITYLVVKEGWIVYPITLSLALLGLIKLFRSLGSIVDARVGNKFLDANLINNQTPIGLTSNPTSGLSSQFGAKNSSDYRPPATPTSRTPLTGTLGSAPFNSAPLSAPLPSEALGNRPPVGRVNREQSSPLKKLEIDDDILSRLRN